MNKKLGNMCCIFHNVFRVKDIDTCKKLNIYDCLSGGHIGLYVRFLEKNLNKCISQTKFVKDKSILTVL